MYCLNKKTLRNGLDGLVLGVLLLLSYPMSASAQTRTCTEEDLRNLGVAILDCNGGSTQCSPGGGVITQTASSNIPEPHKTAIERAASAYSVNPNLIAALFLTEQGNIWKPFEGPYASSRAGASGPFQFMPGTWAGYGTDGNGDGVIDIQNFEDAAHAAARMAATATDQTTPLGDLGRPFVPDTLIYFSATYNWGPANVQRKTGPTSPLSVAPLETENYMKNIHALISSDFTQSGHPGYGPPRLPGDQLTTSGTGSRSLCVSAGSAADLVTNDPTEARTIIITSPNMRWGNYGSATTQRQDVQSCLTDQTLISIATITEKSGVAVLVNALATDHGGCSNSGGSHHNQGRAIDIGYYGNNSRGEDRHMPEGDIMYKFLFDSREVLKIDDLIWQYPSQGYKCIESGKVGECDELYSAGTLNQHYHHIHVSFTP